MPCAGHLRVAPGLSLPEACELALLHPLLQMRTPGPCELAAPSEVT